MNVTDIRKRLKALPPGDLACNVYDVVRKPLSEMDPYHEFRANCSHESVADFFANAPTDVAELLSEIERLRALESLVKWLCAGGNMNGGDRCYPDHKCGKCRPGGENVVDGYLCPWHLALAAVEDNPWIG